MKLNSIEWCVWWEWNIFVYYQNENAEISRIFDVRFSRVEERMYLEQLGNQRKGQLAMTKAQTFKGGLKNVRIVLNEELLFESYAVSKSVW